MRSRKSRRGEWTTTKRGRIVHLAASPPQSLRDYINRARTTSPSATRMSHKDWTNFGGQLRLPAISIITSHEDRRSEEHTSELQSRENLVCRLLLEKKKKK